MTRLLLDTHVFMWWVEADERITPEWLSRLVAPSNEVFVSAVTAFEIETKKRIGKLSFIHDVGSKVLEFEFESLEIALEHAVVAGSLDWDHRDPFDRLLVGQALSEELTIVTADDAIKSAPGVRVL